LLGVDREHGLARIGAPQDSQGAIRRYECGMIKNKKRYLTATMADGYVKTIGPTSAPFTHYWRIIGYLGDGRSEIFWGHAKSLKAVTSKKAATADAARQRGWERYDFEVVELVESMEPPESR
jgi:hypothetical protein